jgi:YkoY family integral membrane protein
MELLTELFPPVDIKTGLFVTLNLIILECLLSIDNAAVLATMVLDLPEKQRGKALKYGIIGAYLFRGVCLIFASYLIQFMWLKAVGGIFLIWLCAKHFISKKTPETADDLLNKKENRFYRFVNKHLGKFWSTVALIEVMDLAFSMDNVFVAVAFSDNIYLIWIGVFIGILAMRFVAQGFVKLLEKFPELTAVAFIVIGVLGVKLVASFGCDFYPEYGFCQFLNGHNADMIISAGTVVMFIAPVIYRLLVRVNN